MNAYLVVLCGLFSVAFSAVMWSPADEGSSICEYEGEKLEIGEIYYPANECYSVECVGNNGCASGAEIKTCPPMPMTDSLNFRYVRRTHLRYPDCCPTIEIMEDNAINDNGTEGGLLFG